MSSECRRTPVRRRPVLLAGRDPISSSTCGPPAAPNNDIYTMKLDGTDLVQLTDTPDDNEYFTDWGIDPR